MTKSTTVYLGDPYQTFLSLPAAIAATTLTVDDVSEFLAACSASVGPQTFTYPSIVGNQLSGVTGLIAAATAGTVVRPMKTWVGGPQNVISAGGVDHVLRSADPCLHRRTADEDMGRRTSERDLLLRRRSGDRQCGNARHRICLIQLPGHASDPALFEHRERRNSSFDRCPGDRGRRCTPGVLELEHQIGRA